MLFHTIDFARLLYRHYVFREGPHVQPKLDAYFAFTQGTLRGHVGDISGHFGVTMGLLWRCYGFAMGMLWCRYGAIIRPLLGH